MARNPSTAADHTARLGQPSIDYDELLKLGPDATWEFPPSMVHLSPESIDALATTIADKLSAAGTQSPSRLYFDGKRWHQLGVHSVPDAAIESLATTVAQLDEESTMRLAQALFERTGQQLDTPIGGRA